MQLYKFQCGSDFGLTRDQAGKNLPPMGTDWTFVKEITVHRAEDAARCAAGHLGPAGHHLHGVDGSQS